MNLYVFIKDYDYGDGDGMVKDVPTDGHMDCPLDAEKTGVYYNRKK